MNSSPLIGCIDNSTRGVESGGFYLKVDQPEVFQTLETRKS